MLVLTVQRGADVYGKFPDVYGKFPTGATNKGLQTAGLRWASLV